MKWYAFDYGGDCCPLGDCGDYDAAEEVADDVMPNRWLFLYTAEDILLLAKQVEKTDDTPSNI